MAHGNSARSYALQHMAATLALRSLPSTFLNSSTLPLSLAMSMMNSATAFSLIWRWFSSSGEETTKGRNDVKIDDAE